MTTPTTYSSVKQYAGIAPETTAGTPVAMTATLLESPNTPEDKYTFLQDKGLRGVMGDSSFAEIPGVRYADLSMGGAVYLDTIGYLLANIMGDLTETGSSAPYSHRFSLLNSGTGQPVTHTLTHYTGETPTVGARVYAGMCLSSLEFSFNVATNLFSYTAKANGWASQAAAAAPTASPTAVPPVASWRTTLGIGGTVEASPIVNASEGKITIMREVENEFGTNGTQDPYIIQRGGLSATFSLTFISNGEGALNYMINNTQPQLQLILANGLTGASAASLQFDIQTAAFKTAKPNYGSKVIKWETTGSAVFNSTNAGTSGGLSPLSVTLSNAIASGSYT